MFKLGSRRGSIVGFLLQTEGNEVDAERDLKETRGTNAASVSFAKTSTMIVSSLTKHSSSIRVERANLCAELHEITLCLQGMIGNVDILLFNVCTEVLKI